MGLFHNLMATESTAKKNANAWMFILAAMQIICLKVDQYT